MTRPIATSLLSQGLKFGKLTLNNRDLTNILYLPINKDKILFENVFF